MIPRWHGVCPACLDKRRILFRLLAYARPHWRAVTVCLLLMLVATSIGLTPPLLMGMLIDDVLEPAQDKDYDVPIDEATAALGLLVVLATAAEEGWAASATLLLTRTPRHFFSARNNNGT